MPGFSRARRFVFLILKTFLARDSGRQHKSLRRKPQDQITKTSPEPVKRATALNVHAAGRFTGSIHFRLLILGLAPQALCLRPLRGLRYRRREASDRHLCLRSSFLRATTR
jgi:hypothetical protein